MSNSQSIIVPGGKGRTTSPESGVWVERSHPRVACIVPAMLLLPGSGTYINGTVANAADSGLYLEAERRLAVRSRIDIFLEEDSLLPGGLMAARHVKAQIKWSSRAQNGGAYAAGARIVSSSQNIGQEHARRVLVPCDLCNRYCFYNKICAADECVYLCRSCARLYPALSEGIKRHLLGNIY